MAKTKGAKGFIPKGAKAGGVIYDSEGKRMYGPEEAAMEATDSFTGPSHGDPEKAARADAAAKRSDAAYRKLEKKLGTGGWSHRTKDDKPTSKASEIDDAATDRELDRKQARLGAKMSKRNPLYDSYSDSIANSAD